MTFDAIKPATEKYTVSNEFMEKVLRKYRHRFIQWLLFKSYMQVDFIQCIAIALGHIAEWESDEKADFLGRLCDKFAENFKNHVNELYGIKDVSSLERVGKFLGQISDLIEQKIFEIKLMLSLEASNLNNVHQWPQHRTCQYYY